MSDGPDFGNLLRLRDMLPSFTKTHVARHSGNKGKAVGHSPHMPDKVCKICKHVWGKAPAETEIKMLVCGECQGMLDKGYTAIVCQNRKAFVKSKMLSAGDIMYVSENTMDALQSKLKESEKPHEAET